MIIDPQHEVQRSTEVSAALVWLSETELVVGREYLLQQGGQVCGCRVAQVLSRLEVDTLEAVSALTAGLNDIVRVSLHTSSELIFDPYEQNRTTGSFILVDRADNTTVAAGMVAAHSGDADWDLVARSTLAHQRSRVSPDERLQRLGQSPVTVLVTGLTGAGKSTIAKGLERLLFDRGNTIVRLDGENMRLGVSKDLGFSSRDRSENVRRTAELARLLNDQGLITIAALVAPSAEVRRRARQLIGDDRFVEVYLNPPVEVCRARDTAGLYAAADAGELEDFPGVSAPYDEPADADLVLDTGRLDIAACLTALLTLLESRRFISPEPSASEPRR